MFSTLLMGGGGHTREKDHQNVKSLIIFAHDCRPKLINTCVFWPSLPSTKLNNEFDFDTEQ